MATFRIGIPISVLDKLGMKAGYSFKATITEEDVYIFEQQDDPLE